MGALEVKDMTKSYYVDPAKQMLIDELYGNDFDKLIETLTENLCETSKAIVKCVHIESMNFDEVADTLKLDRTDVELIYKNATVMMWLVNHDLLIDLADIFKIYPELI